MRRLRSGRLGGAAAALCLGLAALSAPGLAAAQQHILFGASEVTRGGPSPFKKWGTLLERYRSEQRLEAEPCESGLFKRCDLQDWRKYLDELAPTDLVTQINAVNDRMNEYRYITDPVNWGVPDYWAVPREFFAKDGDCEDYAISKYFSLRHLGVPADIMRIVVLHDENLNVAHAVLIIYFNGDPVVLDNQLSRAVRAERIRHYRPIYSVNENGWWMYRRLRR